MAPQPSGSPRGERATTKTPPGAHTSATSNDPLPPSPVMRVRVCVSSSISAAASAERGSSSLMRTPSSVTVAIPGMEVDHRPKAAETDRRNGVILRKAPPGPVQMHDCWCADRRICRMGARSRRLLRPSRETPPVPDRDSSVGARTICEKDGWPRRLAQNDSERPDPAPGINVRARSAARPRFARQPRRSVQAAGLQAGMMEAHTSITPVPVRGS